MKTSAFRPDLLAGQICLVTGGGTGIGRACALAMAAHGADVVVASRKLENLDAVVKEVEALGRRALALGCDIKDPEAVDRMAEEAWRWQGRIDVLLNNSGANFLSPVAGMSANGFKTVVDVVLNGTFHVTRAVGLRMIERGKGRIIMMAATNAENGSPLMAHSGAAKAGVVSLAQSLAVEWGASGVVVNSVCPGPVLTEGASSRLWPSEDTQRKMAARIPVGRFPTADDCVGPVLFLCSEAASCMTGSSIVVDGGERLRNPAALLEAL